MVHQPGKPTKYDWGTLRPEFTGRLLIVTCLGHLEGSMTFAYDAAWWGSALGQKAFATYYGGTTTVTGAMALSSTQQSCGTGFGTAGTMIGCMISSLFGRNLGRKRCLLLLAILGCIGSTIELTSVLGNRSGSAKFWQLVIGKFVVNSSVGIATTVVPPYLAEVSPASIRGFMVTCHNVAETFGGILAISTIFGLQNRSDTLPWMLPIRLQMVIPILIVIGMPLLPESPRWLVEVGRTEDAIKSIERIRGDQVDAASEVAQLEESIRHHEALTGGVSWPELFRGSNRRRTMITVAVTCLQQGMGISMVNNYLVVTLQSMGVKNPITFQFILSACQFVIMLTVGAFAPDRFGRRPMLLGGATLMGAALFVNGGIAAATNNHLGPQLQRAYIAMFFVWVVAFVCSWGPLSWTTMAETPSAALREKSIGLGAWAGFGVGMTVNFVQPYLNASIGENSRLWGRSAFVDASIAPFAVLFTYFLIPELKGRTLEEIDEMFDARVSARKSASYVCRTVALQQEIVMGDELSKDFSDKGETERVEDKV